MAELESRVSLPSGWEPREGQKALWRYMAAGGKRAVAVWHRRFGKDSTVLNWTSVALHQRIGMYVHMLPEAAQARKAVWLAIDAKGRRVIDQAFPVSLRKRTVDQEMFIEFKNGSTWTVAGSDNYNSLVGTNYVGVVFSEYSVGNPAAWDYLRPILTENGGWAVFIYTPRGHNHGHTLYRMAEKNPAWFAETLTVDDTLAISPEDIQAERDSGMDDDMVQQEYFALAPDTKVLTADLRWIPVDDLVDAPCALIGVDETVAMGEKRKMRPAQVTRARRTVRECLRISLDDGRSIVASVEHPWLARRGPRGNKYGWVETANLHVGDDIADSGLLPWSDDRSYEAGWLAGMYDGEGCVSRRTVSVAQKPGRLLDAVRDALVSRGVKTFETQSNGCVSVWCSMHESMRLLGTIRPQRLLEKAERIWNGAYPFTGVRPAKIVAVAALGVRPVVAIETSAKTFIAEGLVTHNCSWEGVKQGSIFGQAMATARKSGRVGEFPYDPRFPVNTFWDLGHGDATAIWFHQTVGGTDRFIRYYESAGQDVGHYVGKLREFSYLYGRHFFPHDVKNVTLASKSNPLGKNTWDQFVSLGLRDMTKVDRTADKWASINAARTRLATATFDEVKCANGVSALESYHKKWNEGMACFMSEPVHDWSSNGCDAFMQWADGYHGQSSSMQFSVPAAAPNVGLIARPRLQTVGHRHVGY